MIAPYAGQDMHLRRNFRDTFYLLYLSIYVITESLSTANIYLTHCSMHPHHVIHHQTCHKIFILFMLTRLENMKGRNHLEDLCVCGKIILD